MKDGNRVSGTDRKDCLYYEDFDSILGTRAATEPIILLESNGEPSCLEEPHNGYTYSHLSYSIISFL